jgi:hypothetical protein
MDVLGQTGSNISGLPFLRGGFRGLGSVRPQSISPAPFPYTTLPHPYKLPMKQLNTPLTPHTIAYRQSQHDSYAGWYESSLLSGLSPGTSGVPHQPLSAADRLPASSEEFLRASPPSTTNARERIRSLRRMKKGPPRSQSTIHADSEVQTERAMTTALRDHESIHHTLKSREVVKPHLSLTMPDNLNSSIMTGAGIPTPQPRRLSTASAHVHTESSPMTATSTKPRKSARFTRLIVEKLLLKPEELQSHTTPNVEACQAKDLTKRPTQEMGPVVRSIEAFFLLLPMLGSTYMLGSACMPYQWWRERLSIVRVPLASGKGESGAELLLSLWGWCVLQPGSER